PLHQPSRFVAFKERIPVAAPNDLDDIPTGPAKGRLQLLNDLAVAAHWAVESLQIAIDDKNQIVEPFASGQGDGAERFRLVGFSVADKAPNVLLRCVLQSSLLDVTVEPGLIDRHDRAEAHRN